MTSLNPELHTRTSIKNKLIIEGNKHSFHFFFLFSSRFFSPCFSSSWLLIPSSWLLELLEDSPGAGKVFDLLADNVNAAGVRRVQLQHHGLHGAAIELRGACLDGRRLARARRPVEQQMRQPVLLDEPLDWKGENKINKISGCSH
jgi:hypothetical protein